MLAQPFAVSAASSETSMTELRTQRMFGAAARPIQLTSLWGNACLPPRHRGSPFWLATIQDTARWPGAPLGPHRALRGNSWSTRTVLSEDRSGDSGGSRATSRSYRAVAGLHVLA